MTKYYAPVFPDQGQWRIPIDVSSRKILAWKTKTIPKEIAQDWREEWGIAELTKQQWTNLLFIDFNVDKLFDDMKKVDSIWANLNVIRKSKAWAVKTNRWILKTDPSQPLNLNYDK